MSTENKPGQAWQEKRKGHWPQESGCCPWFLGCLPWPKLCLCFPGAEAGALYRYSSPSLPWPHLTALTSTCFFPRGSKPRHGFSPLPSQILWLLSAAQDMNCLDHSSQKVGDAETSDRGHGMMRDLCSDKNLHGCAISELSWKKVSWGTHTPIFCPFLPHLNL